MTHFATLAWQCGAITAQAELGSEEVTERTNMAATELKRYAIKVGQWAEFLALWERIVDVRRRHGFTILFAFADREGNMFTWAIDHAADFDAAAAAYYADPDRRQLEAIGDHIADYEIRRVEPVRVPDAGKP